MAEETHRDLLAENRRLRLRIRELEQERYLLVWLSNQLAVFTPEMCWTLGCGQTLSEKILEAEALPIVKAGYLPSGIQLGVKVK